MYLGLLRAKCACVLLWVCKADFKGQLQVPGIEGGLSWDPGDLILRCSGACWVPRKRLALLALL